MRPQTARPVSGKPLAVTLSVVHIPPLLPPVTSPDSARLPAPLTPRLWAYTMSNTPRSVPGTARSAFALTKETLSPKSGLSSPLLGRSLYPSSRPTTSRKRFPWHRVAIGYSGKTLKKPLRGKAGIRPLLYSEAGKSRSEAGLSLVSLFNAL